jgi:small nuclear ribonucleoprotein (snRNP)-like protein
MSLPIVKDFFTNKVTIQIKSGQKFEGLLSQVDYKK